MAILGSSSSGRKAKANTNVMSNGALVDFEVDEMFGRKIEKKIMDLSKIKNEFEKMEPNINLCS